MGELAALASSCLWALTSIMIKGVSARLSASFIMAVRTACAASLLLLGVLIFDSSIIDLTLPAGLMFILLGSMLAGGIGDLSFVRAVAIEDVSRVFTVSSSLYILFSVAGSILFASEPFSFLLIAGGAAVLYGTRMVVVDPQKVPAGQRLREANARPREPIAALRLSVLAALLWTTSLLSMSHALEQVEPLTAASLRLPFIALVLVGLALVRGELPARRAERRDVGMVTLSGVFALASMVLFLVAADRAAAGTVAVLTSTTPVFAVPMAHFFLQERITRRVLIGTAACMGGILLASS